ncbi:MAG: hypothetical protein K2X01_02710 [Cyanobacteria bacterium]|nr:hypothetical protein [Cyanobacteriota bacterium]
MPISVNLSKTPLLSPSPVRFQGYITDSEKGAIKAGLFLPGYFDPTQPNRFQVKAVIKRPGKSKTETISLTREKDYWRSATTLPLGTQYRLIVEDQQAPEASRSSMILDNLEVVGEGVDRFNRIDPAEATCPKRSALMADIFLDAVIDPKKTDPATLPMRNHFNQYGGNEQSLMAAWPLIQRSGFNAVLLKPFIGGDQLSSHRYWTVDPFALNASMSSERGFHQLLDLSLEDQTKIYADGAFVNQGLNGIQYTSLLRHGMRSPFWDWFQFGKTDSAYPHEAHDQLKIGILPSDVEGNNDILYDHVDFRIINDPEAEGYQANRPTFLALYDPRHAKARADRRSEDSIQRYQFPISPAELKKKRAQWKSMQQDQGPATEIERKKLFSHWSHFELTAPSGDQGGQKWDGQIDVAKMNTKNPAVRDYLADAVGFWTQRVKHRYMEALQPAITSAKRKAPKASPKQWVVTALKETLNKTPNGNVDNIELPGELPPLEEPIPAFSQKLLTAYPLVGLNLPAEVKCLVSTPGFQQSLQQETPPFWMRLIGWVLNPITRIFQGSNTVKHWMAQLRELLTPPSFEQQLSGKILAVWGELSPKEQALLSNASVQNHSSFRTSEALFLHLLSGQGNTERKLVEAGVAKTVPASIRMADPMTGGPMLTQWLKQRLNAMEPAEFKALLQAQLKGLDPETVALTEAALNQLELGLNWRIDAAKDVGDMDAIRNMKPGKAKEKAFLAEVDFIIDFWRQMGQRIRAVNPKAAIIAELTYDQNLCEWATYQEGLKRMLASGVFTSVPNMTYMYNRPMRLVHSAPRPDEFGETQLSPSQFLSQDMISMTQSVPFTVQRHYQNLTASHDYPTSSHVFMMNPAIATMDLLKWWGLRDDVKEAIIELRSKAGFATTRESLKTAGVSNLDAVLQRVMDANYQRNDFSEDVSPFLNEASKKKGYEKNPGDSPHWIATPKEVKAAFIDELFSPFIDEDPEVTGISTEAWEALKAAVQERVLEPSEVKAMRAVLTNAVRSLPLGPQLDEKTRNLLEKATFAGFDALKVDAQFGRQLGYQPLEMVLRHIAETDAFQAVLGKRSKLAQQYQQWMYQTAMTPVLDKLTRSMAVQIGSPGSPSIYLPDLLGQSGGEYVKNMFVQNRNPLRLDWLGQTAEAKPWLKSWLQETVQPLLKLRAEYPALDNGVLLSPVVEDHEGIVPLIRDNGTQQVILLVNTGKPRDIGWNKMGFYDDCYKGDPRHNQEVPEYKSIDLMQPVKSNYQLNLGNLHIPAGTKYVDPNGNDRKASSYTVNAQGVLVNDKTGRGIDVKQYKLLVRKST